MVNFQETLQKEQKRLGLKQAELCELLHGIPLRTLQSWLHGEKLPPLYYQELVLEKLQKTAVKNNNSNQEKRKKKI